jgi:sideroflexin-5
MITNTEREKIKEAMKVTNASIQENGELVPRIFRMNGFLFTNIPILLGFIFSKPTMVNTLWWQWVN